MKKFSYISRFCIPTILIIIMIMSGYNNSYAQDKKSNPADTIIDFDKIEKYNGFRIDSLPIYEVIHPDLLNAFDSIIQDQKLCENYTDSLVFNLRMYTKRKYQIVGISPLSKSLAYLLLESEYYIGCVLFSRHIVLIEAHSRFPNLLKKTNNKQAYRFYYYFGSDYPTKDKFTLAPNDDSQSRWTFLYENGKLILKAKKICSDRR